MILASAIVFLLTALGGVVLAWLSWQGKRPPVIAGIGHGAVGGVGMILLVWGVIQQGFPWIAIIALFMFFFAAGAGVLLFLAGDKRNMLPRPLIATHGLMALVAYIFLLGHILLSG
jgi:hypothetical protein